MIAIYYGLPISKHCLFSSAQKSTFKCYILIISLFEINHSIRGIHAPSYHFLLLMDMLTLILLAGPK